MITNNSNSLEICFLNKTGSSPRIILNLKFQDLGNRLTIKAVNEKLCLISCAHDSPIDSKMNFAYILASLMMIFLALGTGSVDGYRRSGSVHASKGAARGPNGAAAGKKVTYSGQGGYHG